MSRDLLKQAAAEHALIYVQDNTVVGLGTGSTAAFFIRALAHKVKSEHLKITTVSSSQSSTALATKLGLTIVPMQDIEEIDLYVDGADEADRDKNLIKGGGGALVQERILAAASSHFVVIVDDSKLVDHIGKSFPVPVEVLPLAHKQVAKALTRLGGKPTLRMESSQGTPFLTDQGNVIIDVQFNQGTALPPLHSPMNDIPGVLGHGIFVDLAEVILVAGANGVTTIS